MRLSDKGKYAVTALLDLALHSGKGPVALADISVDQGISLSYLERLFAALRSKQLVWGYGVRATVSGSTVKTGLFQAENKRPDRNSWMA